MATSNMCAKLLHCCYIGIHLREKLEKWKQFVIRNHQILTLVLTFHSADSQYGHNSLFLLPKWNLINTFKENSFSKILKNTIFYFNIFSVVATRFVYRSKLFEKDLKNFWFSTIKFRVESIFTFNYFIP